MSSLYILWFQVPELLVKKLSSPLPPSLLPYLFQGRRTDTTLTIHSFSKYLLIACCVLDIGLAVILFGSKEDMLVPLWHQHILI